MKILLATYNNHKLHEFKTLVGNANIELISLSDVGFTEEIIENGNSFIENALIKAETIYNIYKIPTLADDSGICIDALDGEPGIHSARFAGEETKAQEKNKIIIDLLKGKVDRNAHYTCALAFVSNNEKFVIEKYCHGTIIEKEIGVNGFGYDPIFYLEKFNKTLGEISLKEKNLISHRGQAFMEFKKYIESKNSIE
ncbi:MAG: RdgB/HAM1 family non-canonical purine NTP pyrophosphatase [Firmicutes bacterium]|nr:RdgB/HAM1 family non-canonical purine NTP pyrophosphatase [Bacillota bacterium]